MAVAGPDDETAPLPVVLPTGDRLPAPPPPLETDQRPRGPFEPIVRASDAALDQIKDLYLTAEAIGEDNLARHFQQVSDRQRQLIKEYFDRTIADHSGGSGGQALE